MNAAACAPYLNQRTNTLAGSRENHSSSRPLASTPERSASCNNPVERPAAGQIRTPKMLHESCLDANAIDILQLRRICVALAHVLLFHSGTAVQRIRLIKVLIQIVAGSLPAFPARQAQIADRVVKIVIAALRNNGAPNPC